MSVQLQRFGVRAWNRANSSATSGKNEAFRQEAERSSSKVLAMPAGNNLRGAPVPWGQVYVLTPRDFRRRLQSPRVDKVTEGNHFENC